MRKSLTIVLFLLAAHALGFGRQQPSEDPFARAVRLHQSGDLDGAVAAYLEFLEAHPDNVEARSNLGAVYARKGDYGRAIAEYKRALERDSSNASILFNLGLAYYQTTAIPDAAETFAEVVEAQPGNRNAVLLLADCHLRMGENKKVIELLSAHQSAHGGDRVLLYLLGTALIRDNQVERGQAMVDGILRDGDSAEARMLLGTARMMARDYRGALDEFERAVELNPRLPSANGYYGRSLLATGDRARALESFRRELEINPNDFDSNLYMGVLFKQDRKFDESLVHLQRALQIRPGAPNVRYLLGSLYLSTGEVEEAQRILERLLDEEPDFVEAHVTLATVYYRLKRKEDGDRHRDIVNRLNAEIQDRAPKPGQELDLPYRGETAGGVPAAPRETAPQQAAPAQGAPAAGEEESFDAIAARASAAREADRTAEALDLYRRGLEMRASWHEGWWYIATLLYEEDRYTEARDAFTHLVGIKPEAGVAWAMRGLCEFQLRNYERAYQDLQKGRSLGIPAKTQLATVTRYLMAILLNYYEKPEAALPILYGLAREEGDSPSIVTAMGLCALALPYLPARLPQEKLEIVGKAGRAQYYMATRKMAEAREASEKLIAEYPATPNVHYSFGVLLLAENPDAALAQFRRELEISPSHIPARLQIAFEHIKRREFDKALPYAREAVRLSPDSFAARNALGRALLEMGQTEASIRELETGRELAPDSPEMYFALARAYSRAGRKEDAERAREEFQRLDRIRRTAQEGPQAVGGIVPIETDDRPRPESNRQD